MLLRVIVVTTLLGSAVAAEVISRPKSTINPLYFVIALTYFLTLVYAMAWPFTESYRRHVAYVQISADMGLISLVVYFTGGAENNSPLLYFISIISASIILYRRGGIAAAAAASLCYGGIVELAYWGILPDYPSKTKVSQRSIATGIHQNVGWF